ncbi:MAG: hypothetical protein EA390_02755 [Balneolaceae bacterium]|nr:MAG: hypothetical protein EA390_02755 [Balneolaceae bacterium]
MISELRSISKTFSLACLAVVMTGFFFADTVKAQSSSQVNIIGIPPILSSPLADDLEQNFRSGQYQVIFNYSSFTSQPVDFEFDFVLTRNNRTLVELTSVPRPFTPGSYIFSNFFEEIQFRESANEILNRLDRDLRNQVVQSGNIPEGNYSLEITARPFTQQTGIAAIPGRALFSVRYPTPPILVSVPDGANVTTDAPTFSWTPVVSTLGGAFEYEFLMVEVHRGQTPLQAINSNREHLFTTFVGQTVLPYTLEYLPLEEGATYAWRVTARDVMGQMPLQNDGESEIYTFTYRDRRAMEQLAEDIRELREIHIVPGFATLSGFENVEVEETANTYILSGPAQLSMNFSVHGNYQFRAVLDRVEIQKTNLANPILTGGSMRTRLSGMEDLLGPGTDLVRLREASWRFGEGVQASASIRAPDGTDFVARGMLQLNNIGLTGQITAERPGPEPLISVGEAPLQVMLDQISATYPGGFIRAAMRTSVLDELECISPTANLISSGFSFNLDCNIDETIYLSEQSDRVSLRFRDFSGFVEGDWGSNELSADLRMRTELSLSLTDGTSCGLTGLLTFDDEDGFQIENAVQNCPFSRPSIDLGFLNLAFSNLDLSYLTYDRETSDWDFEVSFDAELFIPGQPLTALPAIEGVKLSNQGIEFPAAAFGEAVLTGMRSAALNEFELRFTRFDLDEFTFPLFDWDETGPGPWQFEFDAEITTPSSPALPSCFRNQTLTLQSASVVSTDQGVERVGGGISTQQDLDCSWGIGEMFELHIQGFSGGFAVEIEDRELRPMAELTLDAELSLGSPFVCEGQTNRTDLSGIDIDLGRGLSGIVSPFVPDCPVQIGPFTASVESSSLIFEYSETDGQQVKIDAAAEIDLGEGRQATGTFLYDIVNSRFESVQFDLEGPFEWGIPGEDPVLVFTVQQASLNEDGLLIDGRNQLVVGDATIDATFDELLLDWREYRVKSGRVILDEAFALAAGIDPETRDLSFSVSTQASDDLQLSPGLLMQLAGTVIIDSTGVRTSGSSTAQINYQEFELDDLTVEFSEDFALALDPFRVASGEAEFFWNEQRVAVVAPGGFYPDFGFFAEEFLPVAIPLPTMEIAYLQLREDDELVVETSFMDDGTVLIETREDRTLNLVIPALQGTSPQAPKLEVVLENLRVNPSNGTYISGNVYATASEGWPGGRHRDIPISLNEVKYGTLMVDDGEITALFFKGNLTLFDEDLGEETEVALYVQSDGRLKGSILFTDLDRMIPLDPGNNRVVLVADSLAGSFDVPLANPSAGIWSLNVGGGFQINDADGKKAVRAGLGLQYSHLGLSVTDFQADADFPVSPIDLGFFRLGLQKISALSLNYIPNNSFSYFADLDLDLDFVLPDERIISFPMRNVEIRSNTGFVIPSQEIHDGTIPGLELPELEFGIFSIQPLAFRMPRDTIDWHSWSPGDLLGLLPSVDFELSFPGLAESVPEIGQLGLTINDASFDRGIFAGDILPFDLSDSPLFLPIGSGAGLEVNTISGALEELVDGVQGFEVELEGSFRMPDFFGSDQVCDPADVSFSLNRSGQITGLAENFVPCGSMDLGPLSLKFGESSLQLAVTENEYSAILTGDAYAILSLEDGTTAEATGAISMNLITGEVISGSIGITRSFPWYYPSSDSLFAFTVNQAEINNEGLEFSGEGELQLGDGTAGVSFNELTLSLRTGSVVGGNVQIQNAFALDAGLLPLSWSIGNPGEEFELENGLRMVLPENITISRDGITISGESTAALNIAGEEYAALTLNFVEAEMGIEPSVRFLSGRADFLLTEQGQEPVRLAWYDADGFHADNLTGFIPVPDTLALPNKEIAYIPLKDEDGNFLVQMQNVENGVSITTTEPLTLVLAALGSDELTPPSVSASFTDLVINSAYQVISGSIVVNLEESPLNLNPELEIPLRITSIRYDKEEESDYRLTASARFILPESLADLNIAVDRLVFGPGGFEEALITAGTFTESYTPSENGPLADLIIDEGTFRATVFGAEVVIAEQNAFRFSGQLSSSLLSEEPGQAPASLHMLAAYESGEWSVAAKSDHLTPRVVPIGSGRISLDDITAVLTSESFYLNIDGRFSMPDVTGEDLEITINGLRIGTEGVSINEIDTDALTPQSISLFGQDDLIVLSDLSVELLDSRHLMLTLGGGLNFLDTQFAFSGMKIGTNGVFGLEEGLLQIVGPGSPVSLMDDFFVLNSLGIGVIENKAALSATALMTLPSPLDGSSNITVNVNHIGEVTVEGPSFNLDTAFQIGDFGQIVLTGAGMDIDDLFDSRFSVYASARVEAGDGYIEFGQGGSPQNWGMKYDFGENALQWRITHSPSFSFENELFSFSLSNISMADESAALFGLKFTAGASIKLDGVGGSLTMQDMIVSTEGLESLGTIQNGSLNMGPISMEVGNFTWVKDGEVEIVQGTGDNENPESETVTMQVSEYLGFTGGADGGSAISITMPGGFSGNVTEIIYYRTSDELYLNVEGVEISLSNHARLFASLEYLKQTDGFNLRVAGGGEIITPGGDEFGLAALGRITNNSDGFSFGVFVSVGVEIPIFPGALVLSEVGGGFFYKATEQDFEDVLALTGYEMYNNRAPWEDGGEFDFAVILMTQANMFGAPGNYAISARAVLMLTDQWIALNATGTILNQGNRLQAGMYLEVNWTGGFRVEGGVGLTIDYPVVDGFMTIDFIASTQGSDYVWAVHGDGELKVLSLLEAETTFVIGPDGFYMDMHISQGFDVWVIAIHSDWGGSLWWIKGEEFGAYVEIGFNASLFSGAAQIGGDLKGALILDGGYLLYASARAYVSVLFVFDGEVSVWAALRDGSFSGGRGANGAYEQMIAEAQQQAQDMASSLADALAAAQEIEQAPVILGVSEAELAAAGQALASAHPLGQILVYMGAIGNERRIQNPEPEIFNSIASLIVDSNRPSESDFNLSQYRAEMVDALELLSSEAGAVQQRLAETREAAVVWQAEALQALDDVIQNPVQFVRLQPQGDQLPTFSIDSNQNASNQSSLEEIKASVDAMDQMYRAAIDSVAANIDRIDMALSRSFTRPVFEIDGFTGQRVMTDDLEVHPSANQISEQFSRTMEYVDRFYANRTSYYWSFRRWAAVKRNQLQNVASGSVSNAVRDVTRGMLVDYAGPTITSYSQLYPSRPPFTSTQRSTIEEVAGTRALLIHTLDPGKTGQQAQNEANTFQNQLEDFWSSGQYQSYADNFVLKAVEFWYDLPNLGLQQIVDETLQRAIGVEEMYSQRLEPLQNAHQDFTLAVDRLYSIKANMMTTMHGLLDVYSQWRLESMGEDAAIDVFQEKNAIEEQLLPPVISNIFMNGNNTGYLNKMTLSWNATHPTGNIVENSYLLRRGTHTNIMAPAMYSSGGDRTITRYMFKETLEEITRDMSAVVRARGPSGVAISRPATFNVRVQEPVSPFGGYIGTIGGFSSGVAVPSTDPPSRPVVSVPYNRGLDKNGQNRSYWNKDDFEIVFTALSIDEVSDIAGFEFILGTSPGDSSLYGWTRLPGQRVLDDAYENSAGYGNLAQRITIRNLNLEPGQPYYLSVRAINGAGIRSSVANLNSPIRLDASVPTAPAMVSNAVEMPAMESPGGGLLIGSVQDVPNFSAVPSVTARIPEIRFRWGDSEADMAGTRRYHFLFSKEANGEFAFETAGPDDIRTTTLNTRFFRGGDLNFTDEYYLHVRAESRSGMLSEALTIGPVVPRDPTPPVRPNIRARAINANIGFYLTRPALDPETIITYEYGLGTSHYNTSLRSYSTISDFGLGLTTGIWRAAALGEVTWPDSFKPVHTTLSTSGLANGQQLYIRLRARNSQGTLSAFTSSGPIIFDNTAPPVPSISAPLDGTTLNVNMSGLTDPESGIRRVEYRVVNTSTGRAILNWTTVLSYSTPQMGTFSRSRTLTVSGSLNASNIKVYVRVTNGNGLQTVGSANAFYPITYPVFNTNFNLTF